MTSQPEPPFARALDAKYEGEANAVTQLLQQHDFQQVQEHLFVDSQLQPHELSAFMKSLKRDLAQAHVDDVQINDDLKTGVSVIATGQDGSQIHLLDKSADSIAAATDERVPRIGDFFTNGQFVQPPMKVEDVDAAFKYQQSLTTKVERRNIPRIGQILKLSEFGGYSQQQVDAGMSAQDEAKAHQIADDIARGMPIMRGEGYFQMLERSHPDLSNEEAAQIAHRVRQINNGRDNLRVGEQVAVMTDGEREQLQKSIRYTLDQQELGH